MTDFNNLTPTGRKTSGPTADLIELAVPGGNFQTAIVYNDAYHAHTGLTTDVELVQSFLEFPMVDGLSDMTRAVIGKGIFQFDTGSVMVLYDILRAMRDKRKPLGIRAGVELCVHIGRALQEASENGPMQGIYSSNGLTPWRIVIDASGMPSIIGYGLPQIDMVTFRESGEGNPREDSFKCCPPERLLSGDEDISSDVYSLALIAVEVMTGAPLLKGTAKELYKLVTHGEAQQILLSNPGKIPSDVHNILVQALAYDPMGRFEEPLDFVAGLEDALEQSKLSGDSLEAIIKKVAPTLQKGKVLQSAKDTTERSPIPIRMATGGGRRAKPVSREAAPTAHAPDAGDRWGKVARSGASESEEVPSRRRTPAGSNEGEETSSRRTRSARNRTESTGSRRSRRNRTSEDGEEEDSEETTKRSRRSRGDSTAPRRSRRGQKAASTQETETQEVNTDTSTSEAEVQSTQADPKDEAAPKRPRRAKRAAKKETPEAPKAEAAPTEDTPKAEAAPTEDAPKAEAAPKRPRRAKRAAKKETPEAPKAEAAPTEDAPKADAAPTEDAPKAEAAPKRPRRAKRAVKEETKDDSSAEKTSKEEEKPQRARRSSRASASEDSPRRARRSRSSDDSGEETPRRARRTRDATSTEDEAPRRSRRSARNNEDGEEAARPRRSRRTRNAKDE